MKPTEIINVVVTLWAESDKCWNVLVDSSPDQKSWSRGVWFPKSVCELNGDMLYNRRILSAPKWLLDKNKVKYQEEVKTDWKSQITHQIKEATKLNQIPSNLKKLAKELIEYDDKFSLIYSGSRMSYVDIIFKDEISSKTLSFILKNYGTVIFKKIKNNKRLL